MTLELTRPFGRIRVVKSGYLFFKECPEKIFYISCPINRSSFVIFLVTFSASPEANHAKYLIEIYLKIGKLDIRALRIQFFQQVL
jgi:hypothetical protein